MLQAGVAILYSLYMQLNPLTAEGVFAFVQIQVLL